eukprot:2412424-Amphidinium_carterae.1
MSTQPNGQRNYFVLPFAGGSSSVSPTLFAYMNQCSYLTLPDGIGIVDIGTVNAVIGSETLKEMDKQLMTSGVGIVQSESPPTIGGIGGGAQTLMGVLIPVVMESVPGILSAVVIKGSVPLLLPNPLLDSLEARLDMRTKSVQWQACGAVSRLHALPSGHIGCQVMGEWTTFFEKVPGAERFRRTPKHSRHIEVLYGSGTTPKRVQYFDMRGDHEEERMKKNVMNVHCIGSSSWVATNEVQTFVADESLGAGHRTEHSSGRGSTPEEVKSEHCRVHHCRLQPETAWLRVVKKMFYVLEAGFLRAMVLTMKDLSIPSKQAVRAPPGTPLVRREIVLARPRLGDSKGLLKV